MDNSAAEDADTPIDVCEEIFGTKLLVSAVAFESLIAIDALTANVNASVFPVAVCVETDT